MTPHHKTGEPEKPTDELFVRDNVAPRGDNIRVRSPEQADCDPGTNTVAAIRITENAKDTTVLLDKAGALAVAERLTLLASIDWTPRPSSDPFAFAEGVYEDDTMQPDGTLPPFAVFIPSMQTYLPMKFENKDDADRMARILCALKGDNNNDNT